MQWRHQCRCDTIIMMMMTMMTIIHAKHIMHYTTIKYVRFDHAKEIVIEVHINGISVALVSMQSQIYAGKKTTNKPISSITLILRAMPALLIWLWLFWATINCVTNFEFACMIIRNISLVFRSDRKSGIQRKWSALNAE